MGVVSEIWITAQREHAVTGVERAIRVGSRCIGLESEAVRAAIGRARDTSRESGLAAARTLPGHGELIVDRERRRREVRGSTRSVGADGERDTGSKVRGAERGDIIEIGGELICISLTDSALQASRVATRSGCSQQDCTTNQVELFLH